ncbi:MAG TPA: deoxyribose-phosphate aldolase [Prolixibacteraceae bacterium]|nr:deoxyribose-phosphate aldolase [Prolixibacteraceae bacterium]HPR59364.1 deoxyribose-phosphate aldolase [Prolixibacteraceae bacterium]
MTTEQLNFDHAQLESDLNTIITNAKTIYNNDENKKLAFSLIDLTTLNSTDTEDSVKAFTQKVNDFPASFPDMPNVAAICVYPNMVKAVEETLQYPEVNIASVSGGFPSSMTFTKVKVEETKLALKAGADEIDIVLALSHFLAGNFQAAHDDIFAIKAAMADAHLKVILETGALETPENIWKASMLAINAGADFIKTSTGKMSPAATPMAAYVMCLAIAFHFEETGEKIGFKPAGGIVTSEDALIYLAIVKEVLGDEWLNPQLFRLGASRLANNLLSDIYGKTVKFF